MEEGVTRQLAGGREEADRLIADDVKCGSIRQRLWPRALWHRPRAPEEESSVLRQLFDSDHRRSTRLREIPEVMRGEVTRAAEPKRSLGPGDEGHTAEHELASRTRKRERLPVPRAAVIEEDQFRGSQSSVDPSLEFFG